MTVMVMSPACSDLFDNPTSAYESSDEIGIFIKSPEGYRTSLFIRKRHPDR